MTYLHFDLQIRNKVTSSLNKEEWENKKIQGLERELSEVLTLQMYFYKLGFMHLYFFMLLQSYHFIVLYFIYAVLFFFQIFCRNNHIKH